MCLNVLLRLKESFAILWPGDTCHKYSIYVCAKQNIYAITAFEPKWQIEKTKWNRFIYFCMMVKSKKEVVAKKYCNLTQNLCTERVVQNIKRKKEAHEDKIQGVGPDLSGTFNKWISQLFLDFKAMGFFVPPPFFYLFFLLFFCFLGCNGQFMYLTPQLLNHTCVSPSCKEKTKWWETTVAEFW